MLNASTGATEVVAIATLCLLVWVGPIPLIFVADMIEHFLLGDQGNQQDLDKADID